MEEILERQLFIRGRAFATFFTIEKALVNRKKKFRCGGLYCAIKRKSLFLCGTL